ncbi:putative 3-methyladenine DNA glycosylase [Agaricicola taiwanensis]|uniref:Putative 3-methyladenine DNA glycosylase n=1 Tax=Agaricicola taiwanensis TaxID=591372 RepID=A0A8J2YJQ5_9RHOB|nr:DNA-3-methyladenine glycosylase [Agaricicola taiwanensis]GGE48472.1 putative 3-methyladenine DNA glycosylase [Agaricicola taiwanensis]
MTSVLNPSFFHRDVVTVARDLLGATLTLSGVGGRIVETEAYHHEDPASHSFRGPTPRNAAMFGPSGHAYVYLSYGVHWCFNIVCGEDPGSAVLIRALEPTDGIEVMCARRGTSDIRKLCAGPGRLCQALALTRAQDRLPLDRAPFHLSCGNADVAVVTGPRIGISQAMEKPWRFGLAGSRFLSRPFPATASAG